MVFSLVPSGVEDIKISKPTGRCAPIQKKKRGIPQPPKVKIELDDEQKEIRKKIVAGIHQRKEEKIKKMDEKIAYESKKKLEKERENLAYRKEDLKKADLFQTLIYWDDAYEMQWFWEI